MVTIADEHFFEIHPLPEQLLQNSEQNRTPHLIIKRSVNDLPIQLEDDVEGDRLLELQ